MSLNKKIFFSFLISGSLLAVTFYAQAAGLVPCGNGSDEANRCTLCHLFKGIQNIIKWGEGILIIVAIVAIVAGAIMYIISAGNSSAMESAKGIIKQALWGVVITLGAWLIVNTTIWLIGGNLNKNLGIANWYDFQCDSTVVGGVGAGGIPVETGPLGSISKECDKYDSVFKGAAGGDKNKECLLKAIAMQESRCNPAIGTSPAGAVGFMQIKPATAGSGVNLNDAEESVNRASELISQNQSQINKYNYFDASDNLVPGTESVTYPDGSKYYTGNDDLVASYNGGGGTKASDGKMGPFAESKGCKGREGWPASMPAWQCPYKEDGSLEGKNEGYSETRDYVKKVQNYQKQCLGD